MPDTINTMNCEPGIAPPHKPAFPHKKGATGLMVVLGFSIGLITLLAFYGVWNNGFVDYDDNTYVFLNPQIASGLSWRTITWAFTYVNACHWVPVTWLSHAMDCQLYGLRPTGHHITSLLLHIADSVLLLVALRIMTGSVWRSAVVAALFAVHPLHVESVAWVAERKDVLSGFFFMLTLIAYAQYAQRRQKSANPSPGGEVAGAPLQAEPFLFSYFSAIALFAFGLMSKSMLVTMPFLFLLLDWWPLGRFEELDTATAKPESRPRFQRILWLLREKAPFFVLSALACLITYLAQDTASKNMGTLPNQQRWANGILAVLSYLKDAVWPRDLAVFYPPQNVSLTQAPVICSMLTLIGITAVVLLTARKYRFALVGWFWFLGLLAPVSGIVQVGTMVRADRFTYLPSIGLFIGVAWATGVMVSAWPRLKVALPVIIAGSVVVFAGATHRQLQVWYSTHTLFAHAAKVTEGNYVALTMLAKEDLERGRVRQSQHELQRILQIAPKYPNAEYLLGSALQMEGKMQEAIPHLEAAIGPEVEIPGHARLVLSLLDSGRVTEAEAVLRPLLQTNPGDLNGWLMAAAILKEQGRSAEALQLFGKIIAHEPKFLLDNPTMNYELAELYSLQGQTRKASVYYGSAIEIAPGFTNALNNYAWILATDPDAQVRNGKKAVELGTEACRLTDWKQPLFVGTLAAAYAEAGRFEEAIRTAECARQLAQKDHLDQLAKKNADLLELYRQNRPYREKTD